MSKHKMVNKVRVLVRYNTLEGIVKGMGNPYKIGKNQIFAGRNYTLKNLILDLQKVLSETNNPVTSTSEPMANKIRASVRYDTLDGIIKGLGDPNIVGKNQVFIGEDYTLKHLILDLQKVSKNLIQY